MDKDYSKQTRGEATFKRVQIKKVVKYSKRINQCNACIYCKNGDTDNCKSAM